jgi:hypothetical protein
MIYEVMADFNDEYFEYIMSWMAHIVQRPCKPTRIFLAFTGEEGAGKGTMFNTLCRIIGKSALHIAHVAHLLGKFNPQHEYSLLCFLDEAMEPGNAQGNAVLKSLITEPYIHIEEKYGDQRSVKNYMNICAASNHVHIVTAGLVSRRFAVFKVNDKYSAIDNPTNVEYWEDIYDELENGGREAFLYRLLTRDISSFNPRKIPLTQALIEQRTQSLQPMETWLVDSLLRGSFEYSIDGKTYNNDMDEQNNSSNCFSSNALFNSYLHFLKKRNVSSIDSYLSFSRQFSRYEFEPVRHTDGSNNRGYQLGSLEKAREHITKKLKLPDGIFDLGNSGAGQKIDSI